MQDTFLKQLKYSHLLTRNQFFNLIIKRIKNGEFYYVLFFRHDQFALATKPKLSTLSVWLGGNVLNFNLISKSNDPSFIKSFKLEIPLNNLISSPVLTGTKSR